MTAEKNGPHFFVERLALGGCVTTLVYQTRLNRKSYQVLPVAAASPKSALPDQDGRIFWDSQLIRIANSDVGIED